VSFAVEEATTSCRISIERSNLRGREVDVVVHGGDLLYRSRVPAWLAETLAPLGRPAESGVPVLLVPGNHERSRMPFPWPR
jgi:exonuclease SbcD